MSAQCINGSWWPAVIATNFAWHGSWHISSPWLRLDGFPRDCEPLTTAIAWPTVEGQLSRKHQMGSVKEWFPREATSIEIWWSRLVVILRALVTWAIYTQGQLLLWSSPCHAKFVAIATGHQLPLTHRVLTIPPYQILCVFKRLF